MMTGEGVAVLVEIGRGGEGRVALLQEEEGVVQGEATARTKMAEVVLVRLVGAGVRTAPSRRVCGSLEGVVASCQPAAVGPWTMPSSILMTAAAACLLSLPFLGSKLRGGTTGSRLAPGGMGGRVLLVLLRLAASGLTSREVSVLFSMMIPGPRGTRRLDLLRAQRY